MRKIAILFLFVPASAFAAAGIADRYYDHQRWIFPAYAYCLAFGLIILLGMLLASFIWKSKTRVLTEKISQYLIKHRVLAIIISGILLAIQLSIFGAVSWEIIWFLAIFVVFGLMITFPIVLANRQFREQRLLSPFWIKWSVFFAVSSITASVLFIILTNCDMLPGTDITLFNRGSRFHKESFSSHPYDSMKEIWGTSLFYVAEIPLALVIYWLGGLRRYLSRKLSEHSGRKHDASLHIDDEIVS